MAKTIKLWHPVLDRYHDALPQQVEHMIRSGGWELASRRRKRKKPSSEEE